MTIPSIPLRSFGRKQGRAPKGIRQDAMEALLPKLSIPLETTNITSLGSLFEKPYDHYALEIGYGAGEHLHFQASRSPEFGFIGCEPFLNGVGNLLATIDEKPVENIRIWQEDARLLLAQLPDACLQKVFILFPDPWPKTRHHKRRIVKNDLLNELARVMKPNALLRMATDHHDYAAWMLSHIMNHPQFNWDANTPADWQTPPKDWVLTRYQEKALASEITTYINATRIE